MNNGQTGARIITLDGMYENYFMDYASYVILERAVPSIGDGLKPVQRRILHAMKEMDDGRFHKVANIIGQTMQFHPHGDAAIGEALVNLGQKDLLIDCQGNWGDIRTGDSAAASRYIEARLTKFALEVAFNPQTTEWQTSYDGRKREPIDLPMKFPLLLAQGAEGIAVGLSTKILPHNFNELLEASICILRGKPFEIFPDFQTGGLVDVSDYNDGQRGGRVKVRAAIELQDKKTLVVKELPYGVTTNSLIDSILKANEKGKIKIKRVVDNTAENVEILIELTPGVSPEVTMDALFAFTFCELSISPNACIIVNQKPHFLGVSDVLRHVTENTRELLRLELEIKKGELEEKWHFASLEKIFIENRVYREIENCESWEEVLQTIELELKKYVIVPNEEAAIGDNRLQLKRELTQEDYSRLTEIRIKRISKYNTFKSNEQIKQLEDDLQEVGHHLTHLTDFAIAYYKELKSKYGKERTRKTRITTFDQIEASQVVANNTKLFVDRREGFIGTSIKKDEFVCDCSDIDDVIVFRRDGKFIVTRIHVDIWRKGDTRTTYNLAYLDAASGRTMVKRFQVTAITRDKEYDLTKGADHSRILYFSANPNGESEVIAVQLTQSCRAKLKFFDFDFGEISIKGRTSQGNILTKYPVKKVLLKEVGQSTLGALKLWIDEASGKLNTDARGKYLGTFDTGDQLLALYRDGSYEVVDFEQNKRFEPQDLVQVVKFNPDITLSAIYYDGEKKRTLVKRFQIETTSTGQRFSYITDSRSSALLFVTTDEEPHVICRYRTKQGIEELTLNMEEFIDVKGWKALGNKLMDGKVVDVRLLEKEDLQDEELGNEQDGMDDTEGFDQNGQGNLF